MTPNTQHLPEEIKNKIEQQAKESSKMYFSGECKNFEWVTYEDGFINAAQQYATLLHQSQSENQRLKQENERLKATLEWYADAGNYLGDNGELATAWKMDENISKKAKQAIQK